MFRIGYNPNTNMLPMFHFLPKSGSMFQLITGEPAQHNSMLANGSIDMAPISSFSYGEHWHEYAILPNVSVSAKGKVGSILLFSKVPLEDLNGKTVALTDLSATSVNLIKIILHRFYNVFPSYITMPSQLDRMFDKADAALLIGDPAIKAAAQKPECKIFDLGEEWLYNTDCSMTYAVWAFPLKLINERPKEILEVYNLLLEAKQKSINNFNEIILASKKMLGGTIEFWKDYFSRFSYDFNEELAEGLKMYYNLCYEEKLLPDKPDIRKWPLE